MFKLWGLRHLGCLLSEQVPGPRFAGVIDAHLFDTLLVFMSIKRLSAWNGEGKWRGQSSVKELLQSYAFSFVCIDTRLLPLCPFHSPGLRRNCGVSQVV